MELSFCRAILWAFHFGLRVDFVGLEIVIIFIIIIVIIIIIIIVIIIIIQSFAKNRQKWALYPKN